MHSTLTRLIHAVLCNEPGATEALSAFLVERDEKLIDNWGPPKIKLATLLNIWPEGSVGCDFAEHVLPVWNAAYPNDDRPRAAIDAKRRWLANKIEEPELNEAMQAAHVAADVAAENDQQEAYNAAAAAGAAAQIPCNPALAATFAQNCFESDQAHQAAEIEWQLQHLKEVLAP